VKVFNSFVEKRVEIECGRAQSGREFNAKCTLHHVCADASEYRYDIHRAEKFNASLEM